MKNFLVIVYSGGGGGGFPHYFQFKGTVYHICVVFKRFPCIFPRTESVRKSVVVQLQLYSTINYILLSRAVNVESTEESVLMYNYTCTVQVQLIIYYSLEQ